ncbi:hypothetical protein HN011_011336, partial [Eciton burchellii]
CASLKVSQVPEVARAAEKRAAPYRHPGGTGNVGEDRKKASEREEAEEDGWTARCSGEFDTRHLLERNSYDCALLSCRFPASKRSKAAPHRRNAQSAMVMTTTTMM